jgi:Ca-activated chloride channel family protein
MGQNWQHIIQGFNWEQFHFLRPGAFYLFIPLILIAGLLLLGNREHKKWKMLVAPVLRPFMFSKSNPWAMLMPLLFFVTGSSFTILGLAGPSWEKKKLPGEKIQAVVLIAVDLSRSMTAKDIQPDRLERAKFKISDFLDANPRAKAGLLAFAGTAHPVLPFTGDYKLIQHQVSSLTERVMPVPGTDIEVLFQAIDTMMERIQAPSTILLLTDAISSDEAAVISNYMHSTRHHLEIILFSTHTGAEVPEYPKIISKQDPAIIQNLSQDTAITITPLTLDKSDVQGIASRIAKKLVFEKNEKEDEKEWNDMGWLLVIPALCICLFWFRRGWVIQWGLLPLILVIATGCGVNSKHPDWWYGQDYQGQLLENAGRFEEAADKYEDDNHKAIAYFKAGNYEAAADLFALDSSATSSFNRGLALARLGRYDEAEHAFTKAASLDADLKTQALNSLAEAKAAKQKADSVLKLDPRSVDNNARNLVDRKGKEKKNSLKERKAQTDDKKLSSDTRVKKLPTSGDRITDETASNIHIGREAKSPPKDFKTEKPSQSAEQIIMIQTAADPSEFLHRRFELQVKKYYKQVKKQKDPW